MWLRLNGKEKMTVSVLTAAYVIAALLAVNAIADLAKEKALQEQRSQLQTEVSLVRSRLEAAIFMDTYLADSLATVVTIDPDFAIQNWDAIAKKLLDKSHYVRNVGLAPNNIISHTYPLAGNEASIGFDFRTRPEQLATVEKAREMQQVFIAGPLELVQGGQAIIARYPIFSDPPNNQQYWGGVSVVIRYQLLLDGTGVTEFESGVLALRKKTLDGRRWTVFYGPSDVFERADTQFLIQLPSGEWEIAAQLAQQAVIKSQHTRQTILLAGSGVSAVIYLLVLLLYSNYQYAHRESLQDELTLLPNRRFILKLLQQRQRRTNSAPCFAIVNLDVDDFKQVNDRLGHEAGDALLKHIANQLLDAVRHSDYVCRFGGDEFLLLLPDISNEAEASNVIEKLQHAIQAHPLRWKQHVITPSVSVGYAIAGQQSVNELLAAADHAMYRHKRRPDKGTLILQAQDAELQSS
jgi:diguanylate cyclase (GGDEF)-like protein